MRVGLLALVELRVVVRVALDAAGARPKVEQVAEVPQVEGVAEAAHVILVRGRARLRVAAMSSWFG